MDLRKIQAAFDEWLKARSAAQPNVIFKTVTVNGKKIETSAIDSFLYPSDGMKGRNRTRPTIYEVACGKETMALTKLIDLLSNTTLPDTEYGKGLKGAIGGLDDLHHSNRNWQEGLNYERKKEELIRYLSLMLPEKDEAKGQECYLKCPDYKKCSFTFPRPDENKKLSDIDIQKIKVFFKTWFNGEAGNRWAWCLINNYEHGKTKEIDPETFSKITSFDPQGIRNRRGELKKRKQKA